jgi:hypothetical protein
LTFHQQPKHKCIPAVAILFGLVFLSVVTSFETTKNRVGKQTPDRSQATPFYRTQIGETNEVRPSYRTSLEQAAKADAGLVEAYGKLPLSFEANRGQTDRQVKFFSRGRGYTLFLTANEAVLTLKKPSTATVPLLVGQDSQFKEFLPSPKTLVKARGSSIPAAQLLQPTAVEMRLVGANPDAQIAGIDELPGRSNYFIGNDSNKWRTNVPTYAKVAYKDVYPGVDLVYHGDQRQLEYDFVVAPGATPDDITLDVETQSSAGRVRRNQSEAHAQIDAHGDLVLSSDHGEVRFRKPLVYQQISDSGHRTLRRRIDGRYALRKGNHIGFELGAYDASKTLIIDPVLSYSTYLGGSLDDFGNAITVDSSGNVYVAGGTTSVNFPVTTGAFQTNYAGADGGYQSVNGDVFVAKLNPSGSALVYSTYLGGSGDDNAYGIVVDDATGDVYLTGGTNSSNFPVTPGVYQPSSGGLTDLFVTKLNASGSSLLYSTHIGVSTEGIRGFGIAVDGAGSAYVTGNAGPGFPTTPGAFQTGSGAFTSAYVLKLNPSGSAADYSTFLSGGNIDYGESIAVDSNGNAYVTGYASSVGFPTTARAYQTALGGGTDAFVTVLNPTGTGLVYSTFLGGSANDEGFKIVVDSAGMAYVTGVTASSNFPTTLGAFQTVFGGGNTDAFVAKLDPTQLGASSLVYATFLGGSGDENFQNFLRDILAVDNAGNAYVTGATTSTNFPTVNPFQATSGGGFDAFVAKLNAAGSGLMYSTYLGGSGDDFGRGIAVDSGENVYVTGQTSSTNFSITSNSLQATFGGSTDAFVAKIVPISWSPTALTFATQAIGSTSAPQTITLTNERNTAALNIVGISSNGDFAETDTCGSSLAAGKQCAISVTFAPTGPGTRTGSVTVTDDAANSPQIVSLNGFGVGPVVSLGGTGLDFGSQFVGTRSTAQVVSLTNSGNTTLNITSIAITGANSGDFAQTNTCGSSLAAGANCTISVTFDPAATGMRNGAVAITDDATGSPQSISLSGTGVAPAVTLSGSSLSFTSQLITTTSSAQTVTLTNTGSAPLTISSIAISGTNGGDFAQTNTCPANTTLAVNANCVISVTFTPTATGNRTASVTIADNATASPHGVSLAGTGTDYSLVAATGSNCPTGGNCSTFTTISAGQTATYNLQVAPNNGFNGTVALTCKGAPGTSMCSISPASVPPNGSTSYAFAVTVGNTSGAMAPTHLQLPRTPALPVAYAALAFLVVLLILAVRLIQRAYFFGNYLLPARLPALAVLLLCIWCITGCNGGATVQPPTNATLTIVGTSGGVSRTLSLGLTVNH